MQIISNIIFLGIIFSILIPSITQAQYNIADLPSSPTCDLCGGCSDADGNTTKPPDWERCQACLYDGTTPKEGKSWTPLGCIDTQAGNFIQAVLRFVISIAGGIAFLALLWGGFQLITSSGDTIRIESGKHTIMGAIGALFLILFAVFILQFIGVSILGIPLFR